MYVQHLRIMHAFLTNDEQIVGAIFLPKCIRFWSDAGKKLLKLL